MMRLLCLALLLQTMLNHCMCPKPLAGHRKEWKSVICKNVEEQYEACGGLGDTCSVNSSKTHDKQACTQTTTLHNWTPPCCTMLEQLRTGSLEGGCL